MPLQIAVAHGLFKRKRRHDAQLARRVDLDAAVQRVDKRVGFAHAERDAQNDVARDRVEHVVDRRVDGVDEQGFRHGVSPTLILDGLTLKYGQRLFFGLDLGQMFTPKRTL